MNKQICNHNWKPQYNLMGKKLSPTNPIAGYTCTKCNAWKEIESKSIVDKNYKRWNDAYGDSGR